jgi:hypothetical protein
MAEVSHNGSVGDAQASPEISGATSQPVATLSRKESSSRFHIIVGTQIAVVRRQSAIAGEEAGGRSLRESEVQAQD